MAHDHQRADRVGRGAQRNREYISLFADDAPVLRGRTPMQCYTDFMAAFRCEPAPCRRALRGLLPMSACAWSGS